MFGKIKKKIFNWLQYDEQEITIGSFYNNQFEKRMMAEYQDEELKFIEEGYLNQEYEVETHNGWSPILSVLKTVIYQIYRLELENGCFIDCADHHLVIDSFGNPKRVNELTENDLIQTKFGLSRVKQIIAKNEQENMFDLQLLPTSDHTFYSNNILSHNTTSSAALILFFVLFNKNKEIAILANKQSTTKEILDRIKIMYRHLPVWLKPGIREWNKHSIEFENGCKITAASTSAASISGKTISLLYIDEFALIPKNIIEDFIDSTFPVIAASVTSRILISSTPKGKNHFYRFFMDAKNRKVTKSPFIAKDIPWDAHPDRNEAWKKDKIKELGSEEKFNQEFGGDFLDTSDMLINGIAIEYMERNHRRPPLELNLTIDGQYIKGLKIYDKPIRRLAGIPNIKDHTYVLIADVGEGKGLDASACSVVDVTTSPFRVVATFKNSEVGIIEFPYIIYQLATYFNDAYIIVENNFNGSSIVKDLWHELEYPNIVNLNFLSESKMKITNYTDLGIKTTKKSKKQGCLFLKYLIENHKLIIPDTDTIDELYHFVRNPLKGTYSAESGYHDDLVMTLVIFSYMAKTQDYFKYILYEEGSREAQEKNEEFDSDKINPFVMNEYKDEVQKKEAEDLKNKSLFIQSLGGDKGKSRKDLEIEKARNDISWLF